MSRWTEADLAAQFGRVLACDWLGLFENSSSAVGIQTEMLLAIASRETNLRNIKGDFRNGKYHGFGMMQVDTGTDPVFCSAWSEDKVAASIQRGSEILAGKRAYLVGKGLSVTHQSVAAAYNTGEGNVLCSLRAGIDPDSTTTGGDYGQDVLARMRVFGRLLREQRLERAQSLEISDGSPGLVSKAA